MADKFLSTLEAAEKYGYSHGWFELHRCSGDGPPYEKVVQAKGKYVIRYRLSELEKFFASYKPYLERNGMKPPPNNTSIPTAELMATVQYFSAIKQKYDLKIKTTETPRDELGIIGVLREVLDAAVQRIGVTAAITNGDAKEIVELEKNLEQSLSFVDQKESVIQELMVQLREAELVTKGLMDKWPKALHDIEKLQAVVAQKESVIQDLMAKLREAESLMNEARIGWETQLAKAVEHERDSADRKGDKNLAMEYARLEGRLDATREMVDKLLFTGRQN